MVKPILYYHEPSPPSRACLLTARYIGLDIDIKIIDSWKGEHLTPEFRKLNPQHTIPLLDDNGVIIYDSHAICAYLVGKYGKNDQAYPKDLVKRAQVDARLYFDAGHLFARVRFMYEPILYGGSKVLLRDRVEYMAKSWDIVEAFLETNQYLCGDELTIADISCISSICSADQIVKIDAEKYPKLIAWMKRIESLPYYDEACGAGGRILQEVVLSKAKLESV